MTFGIGRLYHLTQVVDDLDAADTWYSEVFGALRIYRGRHEAAMRDASILVIGNAVIEVIQVVDVPGAAASPIGKFRARFGQHMHSLAMFVDDLGDVGEALGTRGVRMSDTIGRPITEQRPDRTIWTHPRDTIAMFQFASVPRFGFDPRLHPSWTDDYWRQHPVGMNRLDRCTIVVNDLERAKQVFTEVLGRTQLGSADSDDARTATYAFGPDLDVRLLEPLDAESPEGRELATHGEGLFGFSFRVGDVDAAARHLDSCGVPARHHGQHTLVIDPTDAFGISLELMGVPDSS